MKHMIAVGWCSKYRQEMNRCLSLQPGISRKDAVLKNTFTSNFFILFFMVAVVAFFSQSAAVAQEGIEQTTVSKTVSKEEIENFKDVKKAAGKQRVEENVEGNKTGTDPRDFSLKWMPYYRHTELENGLIQQDLTAFGTVPFSRTLGMFFEVPVAQYRDFSDVAGLPAGSESDTIGMGDVDLKFLWNPEALGFSYGKGGKMSGSVLLGTDFILPTATVDALAGNALLFAPIVGVVMDMPLHGFLPR